ncbi:hypothetical protein FPOAC2_14191 [Fusarium poae]
MSMPINPYLCGHQLMRFYLSQQLESNFHHLTLYTPEDLALMVECEAHGDDADEEDFPAMWATSMPSPRRTLGWRRAAIKRHTLAT